MTEDQKRDKYYKKTYGISLARYNEMLAENNGCCWACGWKPTEDQNRLAVDHLHYKVVTEKLPSGDYSATAPELSVLKVIHKFKKHAIAILKPLVQHMSVRGLLCFSCNQTLKKARDDADRLFGCHVYLESYYKRRNANYRNSLTNPRQPDILLF